MYQQEHVEEVQALTKELGHLTDALNAVVSGSGVAEIRVTYGSERVFVPLDAEEISGLLGERISGIGEELAEIALEASEHCDCDACDARGGF